MQIFNHTIQIRDYVCSPIGGYKCSNSMVNLYIYASGFCPAHCSFCPGFSSRQKIDFDKLKSAITELHDKQVINRISITGGEPLTDLKSLDKILQTIVDVCGKNHYHISINTSGINLPLLRSLSYFDSINDVHISRHSDNDIDNDLIFGIKTISSSQISKEIELGPRIFSLSCNLMKGYIDSPSKLKNYLDYAINLGAYQVGFVSLMNKTSSCEEAFIDYESITSKLYARDGFLFETMAKDNNSCKCENFSYYNDNGTIPFYLRRILDSKTDCVKSFVFNPKNNLVTNFGKEMVLL